MPQASTRQKTAIANGPIKKGPVASKYELAKILTVGIMFHLIAVMSIFDIYFKSPLSQGQAETAVLPNAPAKRLFFIIGDGLRADKCFLVDSQTNAPRARFLHSMAATRGAFGVSHTRVPTESRPGHVAMLAGFYEDPSAVTKGWKENPVEYDHVIGRAQYAFTFGAPEIVSLFPGRRVYGQSYDESLVDFGLGRAVVEQDKWPFDRLYDLFEKAKLDLVLNDKLRSDRVFFMLHLLGHDTNGHAYGPHSVEYADNTRFIDGKVEELVKRVAQFYNDDKSVFLFTADHGMSDGRSHGDGDPDNTRTPLIVWGAGVAGPEDDPPENGKYNSQDAYSAPWGTLSRLRRRDIRQADLAPLVSSLLGIPIPLQSEGKLPIEYLRDKRFAAQALLRNCKQMLENYRVKETHQRQKHAWWSPIVPYKTSVAMDHQRLHALERSGSVSVEECDELMQDISDGIHYLNTYDQTILFALMTAGFLGWMVFGSLAVIKLYTAYGRFYSDRTSILDPSYVVSAGLLTSLSVYLYGRSAPLGHYCYAFFPAWFLKQTLQSRDLFSIILAQRHIIFDRPFVRTMVKSLMVIELVVFAYFDRRWMTVIYGLGLTESADRIIPGWPSMTLSVFTLLPTIKSPNPVLFTGGSLMATALLFTSGEKVGSIVQLMAYGGAMLADRSLSAKQGLPTYCQVINWAVLLCGPLLYIARSRHRRNMTAVFAMLCPILTVLSVSYEVAFFSCFFLHHQHRQEQHDIHNSSKDKDKDYRWLHSADLLLTADFIAAINMAFFGTGNMASLSSFQLPSVYRLVTAFRPFAMGALLIAKQLVPLVFLSPVLIMSARTRKLPAFSLFLLACSAIDLITVHFFFKVSNVGSWLEIGMGISRFVIASVFILIALMMYGVGEALLV